MISEEKEAIKELKILKEDYWEDDGYGYATAECQKTITALDMAIEALEQEPCEDWYDVPSNEMTLEQARQAVKDLREKLAEYLEQQPCEDDVSKFISRQVSLLEERMSSATSEGRWVEEEKCQCAIENLELVDEYIKAHPPVTPKEKTGKYDKLKEAVRKIKAEIKAYDKKDRYPYGALGVSTALKIIDNHTEGLI